MPLLSAEQRAHVRVDRRSRLRARARHEGALPRELPAQADRHRRGVPRDPDDHQDARRARRAAGHPQARRAARRPRARHRPDRQRQVDDARRDDRSHQPHALRPHPHDRGSGRVRAPAAQVPRSRTRRSASTCRAFLDAIRSAGRENADVILVGELRGAETMKAALQLASFGILIFATVHTNSAAATIDRYVNAFPADQQPQIRGLLADSLAGVVAQQLLAEGRRRGPRRRARDPARQPRARVADPRGQDPADRRATSRPASPRACSRWTSSLEKLVRAGHGERAEAALEKALDKDGFAKLFPQA